MPTSIIRIAKSFSAVVVYFITFPLSLDKHAYYNINNFYSYERSYHSAKTVDEKVVHQQFLRRHRAVFDAFQCEGYQHRNNDRIKNDCRQDRAVRVRKMHDIENFKLRINGYHGCGYNCKIFRHVVGNTKSRQGPPRYQYLLADLNNIH